MDRGGLTHAAEAYRLAACAAFARQHHAFILGVADTLIRTGHIQADDFHGISQSQEGNLLAIAEVMTGLRFPGSELLTLFQGKQAMIESPVVQRWKAESLHDAIIEVLKDRFRAAPRDITKPLREILNEKKLKKLNVLAAKCPDLDAFREALSS